MSKGKSKRRRVPAIHVPRLVAQRACMDECAIRQRIIVAFSARDREEIG